jgi:hypothetical protein
VQICVAADAWLLAESFLSALYFLYLCGTGRFRYENEEGISFSMKTKKELA